MTTLLTLMIVMATITNSPLEPCSSSPNCVSSQATDNHFIESLATTGGAKATFNRLKEVLKQRPDTSIIAVDDKMIQVEFKTSLGFVDDGLFALDPENNVIHVRSASRSGYWDFGKNRRRIEGIRKELESLQ